MTGRTASADPNAQNFPKRGPLAKAYRKIFIPTDGYVFVECDLSQAELRIAAWMANDAAMLKVYRDGGDIHAATAAAVMGITLEQFDALPSEVKKAKRQQAKADRKLRCTVIHKRETSSVMRQIDNRAEETVWDGLGRHALFGRVVDG